MHFHFTPAIAQDFDRLLELRLLTMRESLEHFYIAPAFQGHGLGTSVLSVLLYEAGQQNKSVRLSTLQQSNAARFYEKHGFQKSGEDDWDIYYEYSPVISRES